MSAANPERAKNINGNIGQNEERRQLEVKKKEVELLGLCCHQQTEGSDEDAALRLLIRSERTFFAAPLPPPLAPPPSQLHDTERAATAQRSPTAFN